MASTAQAGVFCSTINGGVIDGSDPAVVAQMVGLTQITIDMDCSFLNFTAANPLNVTLNFQTNDPSIYLIVFDNVVFDGNMACSNIDHKLWAVNSSGFTSKCQDIMIPAEAIAKQSPAAIASVGVPFTYTLTLPSMNYPAGAPSPNEIRNVILWDDLSATGADLSYVGITAHYLGSGTPVTLVPEDQPMPTSLCGVWTATNLCYKPIPIINPGEQIVVELTVVANDVPANGAGATFVNTAKWWFGRDIDINGDGIITPQEQFTPLPGEWGVAAPMTIAEPNLMVTKSSSTPTMNLGTTATYTVDVQNIGGATAWNATILDNFPAGMCDYDPTTAPGVIANIYAADGVTLLSTLTAGADYTLIWSGAPTCQLGLNLLTPLARIEPNQHLKITYPTKLNATVIDGSLHTNVAGATQWFGGDASSGHQFGPYALTDGSLTYEDSATITATLSGYYFTKSVMNLTTGVYPATTAEAGDTLRYTVQLENFNIPSLTSITISDELDKLNATAAFVPGSLTIFSQNFPVAATVNPTGGAKGTGLITISGFDLGTNQQYQMQFDITLAAPITNGTVVHNQADITGTDTATTLVITGVSDDPFLNGPAALSMAGDTTDLLIQSPGALQKTNSQTTAMIGEQFTYTITVPDVAVNTPLYDVKILDDLAASNANLSFVSAAVISGGAWSLTNTGTASSVVLEDLATGIDIPANGQAVIAVTVELLNTATNVSGLLFNNHATYSYNRANGSVPSTAPLDPATDTTADMTVVEPTLTMIKTVTNATVGKASGDPITGGDLLQYVVTVSNGGSSTAFDVNLVDTLPPVLAFDAAFTPTATINTVPVAGFIATPTGAPAGPLVWGLANGDGTLDIPVGQSLVLTYQAQVQVSAAASFTNEVWVDWSSLDGGVAAERTGNGCPTTVAPDNYCFGPVTVASTTLDNNSLTKVITADSYVDASSTAVDATLRVGDTATYQLQLNLGEGTTNGVQVSDVLPAGMAFDSLVSISPASGVGSFTYTVAAQPAVGAAGTLLWDLGNVLNTPSGDSTPLDTLTIEYTAKVLPNAGLAQALTTALTNTATLVYLDGAGAPVVDPVRLQSSATLTLLQPVMSSVTKTGNGASNTSGTALNVNVATDTVAFQLQSCNSAGGAPAYGVLLTDLLATQLDESSISGPVNGAGQPDVSINGVAVGIGAGYTYTAPAARGGSVQIQLDAPVNPGQCVTVDYTIGFHTDIGPNEQWNNSVTQDEYWSLPLGTGQQYAPVGPAQFFMANLVTIEPLLKALASPAGGEATIGEDVVYTLTVPGTPMNMALNSVVVSDTLHGALEYVSATAVDGAGNPVVLTDNSVAPGSVSLGIAQIPAGEQAIITLTTRVANNVTATAATSVSNTASYTYTGDPGTTPTDGSSAALTIVEPLLTLSKAVVNTTSPGNPPKAGEILRYTLTLPASGGAPGDNFSSAFDVSIEDSLSLGLAYVAGNATVDGGNTITDPTVAGDGVVTGQTLNWSLAGGDLIDVAEGTTVTITYDVRVLDSVLPGQTLSNSALARWTGLSGVNVNERSGSGAPVENDYFTTPATSTLTVSDNTTLTKSRLSDTWGGADANVRVGDIVDFELRIHLDEGSHSGLLVTDALPQGLDFIGVVSINGDTAAPYSAVAPFTHADIAAPVEGGNPASGPSTVTWTLGDITNVSDGNAANDDFVIVYRAQLLNNDVFAQLSTTQTLTNTATLDYTTAAGPASKTGSDAITLLQPNLSVSKVAVPAGGDTFIVANEVITYTVDIANIGDSPAYDVVVEDILPAGLRQGGVTTTGISLLAGGALTTTGPSSYNAATGLVTWDLGNSGADAYTIPPGDTLRIVYTVTADPAIGPGLTLSNAATATLYYSFDNEALPAGALATQREVYGPSNAAVTTLTTDPGAPLKENTVASATIGEEFSYTITVPQTPQPTPLYDVRVLDDLSAIAADVTLVGISTTGPWTLSNGGTSTNLIIEDTGTGIDIPAGQQAVITVTLRINNVAGNAGGVAFSNTASYTYDQLDGNTGTQRAGGASTTALMSVVEPTLTVTKVGTLLSAAPVSGGDIIEYVVTLDNSGGSSTAFDLNVVDTLPPELAYYAGFTPTATIGGTAIGGFVATPAGTSGGPLIWGDGHGDGSLDIPAGQSLLLTYRVQVQITTAATFNNTVAVDWTSLQGGNAYERTGAGCPTTVAPNDYCAIAVGNAFTIVDANSLTKLVAADSWDAGGSTVDDATVRVGDRVTYRLQLSLGEGTIDGVTVSDVLPAGLVYEGLVGITASAGGSFSYTVAAQPTAGATGTLSWDLGTIINAPSNDGTPLDLLTIEYTARVLNNSLAQQAATTLTNTATLAYLDGSGATVVDAARLQSSAALNLWQPALAVAKSSLPVDGSTVVAAQAVSYTVDITNSGNAPAYDTVVQDILPVGMRQGGVTTTSIGLLAGGGLPLLAPLYDPASGVVTWDLSAGTSYAIPAGDTLRIAYTVQTDATLAPSATLTNAATATLYHSFDNNAIPSAGALDQRQTYGPTNTAQTTLTTAAPVALLKSTLQSSAAVGDLITYTVTVPGTLQPTALNDVRLLDDLTASTADLTFVSATVVSGGAWTLVNSGSATNLIIEDTTTGIDIPANSQAEIAITVRLEDTVTNVSGLVFNNSADYTYNALNNNSATQAPGLPGTSNDTTIVGPDTLFLQKSGPATMRLGLPATFTLDVQNTGSAPAWDLTLTDILPDATPGGMCGTAPVNVTAQVVDATGVAVSPLLTQGSDYVVGYSGCTLTLTMQTTAIGPTERLIVTYDAQLDMDSVGGTSLINVAAATEWFSGDTAGAGASGTIRTYTGILSTGTVGTDDEQDAHTLTTESPVLLFQKTVFNVSSGLSGANAQPGDTLRYTLHVQNISPVIVPSFSIVDELDALNSMAMYAPGTLATTTLLPAGADGTSTNPNGGAKGSGLLDIRNLSLDAQGGTNDTLDIVFEVTLAPVITSGTVVLNQAHLSSYGIALGDSDDPVIAGAQDPTQTLIASAPVFVVQKSSQDISGDPAVLLAGDTLRYTITVKNIGNENAINTLLRDLIPANTSYLAGTTTLNGNPLSDPTTGISPLQVGTPINALVDITNGAMRADATSTTANVATIVFDVLVSSSVVDGTVISNQGFVSADGVGSGAVPIVPSDDPATVALADPTLNVIGNLPLIDVQKTVQLLTDGGTVGIVDPDDVLRYTITVSNFGTAPATGVRLVDAVPANTSYEGSSTTLNGNTVSDPALNVSPLIVGIDVSSSDLPPPLAGAGVISAGQSAVVVFDVRVNLGTPADTIISNQGTVYSNEQPSEPTDADGIDSNGDQPTEIRVGTVPLLSITKAVSVIGGGPAVAGAELEYVIRVQNTGTVLASDVVITDNLDLPVAGQLIYLAGSATLNGMTGGVGFSAPIVTANYATAYGNLPVGATAELRFRATIDPSQAIGTTISNGALVQWNLATQSATATVDITVGGIPGVAQLSGQVWHDADFDLSAGSAESLLSGWSVMLYRDTTLLATVLTDVNGKYQLNGLAPNDTTTDRYSLRFAAPGSGGNTAKLGVADSPFTDGLQTITQVVVAGGTINPDLNLPLQPNGVVYNTMARTPVAGATLTMLDGAGQAALPASCFDDPAQQNQVSLGRGYYRFDLNFSNSAACPAGGDYLISVTPPASGYEPQPSLIIPPQSDAATAAFSVPACLGSASDAVLATATICEAVALETAPPSSIAARTAGTNYYLHLLLDNNQLPGESQLYNNHIPIDPVLDNAVVITKTSARVNVSRGEMVPYTITLNNSYITALQGMSIVDTFPPGFKYVRGSARLDGVALEPLASATQLRWDNIDLATDTPHSLQLLFVVSSGVSEGNYVNRAQMLNTLTNGAVSGEATATVRVVPDPTFDCTDIIGKVFDDHNLDGQQDAGEAGLPGVRLVTARGLIVTTDEYGRFHLTCAMVPNESRGSSFILKLDDRSLPSGYRVITENPRVQRLTRGKMAKFNFGATIHRVVRLDVADGVFEPGTTTMRPQWQSRIPLLLVELKKGPAVLRLSYLADVEAKGLVSDRMTVLKKMIDAEWALLDCCYKLSIESEIFWRRGAPPKSSGVID